MSVSLQYTANISVTETLTANVPAAQSGGASIQHTGFNTTATLDSTTVPPITQVANFTKALSGGAATIDMTALTGTQGALDATGLRVHAWKFKNLSTNANAITVTFGAATAYLLGGTAFKWILQPGQEIMGIESVASNPVVSASLKNIDLSGTASQTLQVSLVFGA